MRWFLFATILQGLLLLFLLYSNIALLIYHPPDSSRPIDTALIHAPLRFFLILPLSILLPLCLLFVFSSYLLLILSVHSFPLQPPVSLLVYHSTPTRMVHKITLPGML